eukprot:Nitzschia sp. Nitz4//scaffold16_size188269//123483//124199//NITZ4_001802-RA/size188269-processed-gene-0.61-mRNA-1//-1//CDS//3329538550//2085//frame0
MKLPILSSVAIWLALPTSHAYVMNNTDSTALEDLPKHKFPAQYYFETKGTFTVTSELLAQVEQAFVESANDVHKTTDIECISDEIYLVEEVKKAAQYVRGEDGQVVRHDALDSKLVLPPPREEGSVRSRWVHPKYVEDDDLERRFSWFYVHTYSFTHFFCRFCKDDDDYYYQSDADMILAALEKKGGKGKVLKAWEKNFCARLKILGEFDGIKNCRITVDYDHDEPDSEDMALEDGRE